MRRPIVFRARHRKTGQWFLSGAFFERKPQDEAVGVWCADLTAIIANTCLSASDFPHLQLLDPDTLGQWTGRRDSNGRMVFEGDILEFAEGDTCSVRYLDNKARFDCAGKAITDWDQSVITVVGTAHDETEEPKG